MSSYWRRRADLLIGHRVPPEAPVPPARPSPVHAMLAEEFADLPFGGHAGEMLSPIPPEPGPPPGQGFEIEPPPWQAKLEAGDLDVASLAAPPQAAELTALAEMKLASGDADEPPPPAPPMLMQPLTRPAIPEVDWRQEERERAARAREPHDVPPKSMQSRPA